ncbi:hypothetical protein ACQ4LE_010183 [Meloidogyne hapla]|uniref:Uncharacterized protein n=1 Tax=Meloidogyne hapla TaxID=6305 RepID=A0A1I8BHA9_MELHA
MMENQQNGGVQQPTFLSKTQKGKSEEQINMAKLTAAEILKKSLKVKSHSQTAIRVGPFAAIREAEFDRRRRQTGSSLDDDELGDNELKALMSEGTFTTNNNDTKTNKNINRDAKN